MQTEDSGKRLSRRGVLGWLLATSGGSLLGVLLYPVLRYILPPPQAEAVASAVVAGKTKDFPPNSGKVIRFGARPAIVVRLTTGEFRALSAVCTHLGCIVHWNPEQQKIQCPCHAGVFTPDGTVVSGPPPRPLASYPTQLVAGKLRITT